MEQETHAALRHQHSVSWVGSPYYLMPWELLVYESFRLMHTLVTDTQSDVWHNAVEEALLYGLCRSLVRVGRKGEFAREILHTVNALRHRVGRGPLRSFKNPRMQAWEDQVLDRLLFSDRDWQMHDRIRPLILVLEIWHLESELRTCTRKTDRVQDSFGVGFC